MMRAVRKLRGRSFAEFADRARQAMLALAERVQIAVAQNRRFETPVSQPHSSIASRVLFVPVLGEPEPPAAIVRHIYRRDGDTIAAHRSVFESLLRGRVSLLGLPTLDVGDPPNWHRDACSGRVAPLLHWSRVPYLNSAVVGDHKVLWEINRHQYLLAPAMCWLHDGDLSAFALVQRHLGSWLDNNPDRLGVNWASSLEVSYRAIAWCWLLWLLRDAPWDTVLLQRLSTSLERHALHVERYLSTYFSPNTHLTGEALGLFYVGSVLPQLRHASRWRKKGSNILEQWLDRQVYADGIYFEQASQYQRYTAEIYLHYWRLSQSSGRAASPRVRDGINRLFDVLRSLVAGDGRMPLIGDDDGGLLMPVDALAPDDLRGLLLAGATALDRPELVIAGEVHPAMSYWLCGVAATEKQLARRAKVPDWQSMLFANGGTAVLRDGWSTDAAVAVIDAGPHGALNCGHAHADALSCTLSLGTTDVFIDRGTLTYVGHERNVFRATASHNTLEIDDESSITPQGPFQWGAIPLRPALKLRCSDHLSIFEATAPGHLGKESPSVHQRLVLHQANGVWIIFDAGRRANARSAVARWQLAPRLTAIKSASSIFDLLDAQQRAVARVAAPLSESAVAQTRDVSPRYGARESAQFLELAADQQLRVLTILLPAGKERRLPDICRSSGVSCMTWTWIDANGSHQIMVSSDASQAIPNSLGWQVSADMLWCCQAPPITAGEGFRADLLIVINPRLLVAPGGIRFATDSDDGRTAASAAVVLSRTPNGWAKMPMSEPARGLEYKQCAAFAG